MKNSFLLVSLILLSPWTLAEEQVDSNDEAYQFIPVLIDGSDNAGAVLGLRYGLEATWNFFEKETANSDNLNSDRFNNNAVEQMSEEYAFVKLELNGLWTNDKAINPESFSKLNLDIGYSVDVKGDIDTDSDESKNYDFSLQLAIEGDQNYSDTQTVVALQAGTFFGNPVESYIAATIALGNVDASRNDERMVLTNSDSYDRVSAELHIQYPLKFKQGRKYSPKSIAFNFRYYKELDAPSTIEQAGLDVFQYGTIRLKFEHGLYLGYANGKLPFDVKSESSIELGFSQNLF